jgi:uncharacterized protein YecE (DUF72 family)
MLKIYVGCCGFAKGMKKYFQEFSIVEIQSTFYRLPQLKTVERWRKNAPENFVFTIKAFQALSHPTTSPTWRRSGFKESELNELKNKVGYLRPTKYVFNFWNKTLEICKILNSPICLIQLPKSFRDISENLKNAEKFFSKIKRNRVKIAVELRGWGEKNIKALCKKFELIDCCDPFARLPVYLTKKKIAYLRLHGSPPGKQMYNYKYTKKDLEKLKILIEKIKAKEIYILFNNIAMYDSAKQFLKLLG